MNIVLAVLAVVVIVISAIAGHREAHAFQEPPPPPMNAWYLNPPVRSGGAPTSDTPTLSDYIRALGEDKFSQAHWDRISALYSQYTYDRGIKFSAFVAGGYFRADNFDVLEAVTGEQVGTEVSSVRQTTGFAGVQAEYGGVTVRAGQRAVDLRDRDERQATTATRVEAEVDRQLFPYAPDASGDRLRAETAKTVMSLYASLDQKVADAIIAAGLQTLYPVWDEIVTEATAVYDSILIRAENQVISDAALTRAKADREAIYATFGRVQTALNFGTHLQAARAPFDLAGFLDLLARHRAPATTEAHATAAATAKAAYADRWPFSVSVRGTVRRDFTDDNVNIDRVSGGVAVVIPFGRPSSVQKADAAIAAESARMADEIEQQTRDLFAFRYRQAEQDAKAAYLAAREARVMAEAAKVRWQYGTGTPEEYLSALARWMQADYAALRAEQERLLLVFRTAAFFGVPFRDFADYMAYLPWPM